MGRRFLPYGGRNCHSSFAKFLTITFTLITLVACASASVDFDGCRLAVQNGSYGSTIGLDAHGHPVQNISLAKRVTYSMCPSLCGAGSEAFDWSLFASQFNSWLIPWLALLSQLPLGAEDRFDNLMSVLLAIGSPALVAYSLVITLLNNRWLAGHMHSIKHQNAKHVVAVFFAFQQIPIKLKTDGPLLSSLIVLPHNRDWWSEMARRTMHMRTWNVPIAVNIAWVSVALIFTIIDSINDNVFARSNGYAVAAVWLWLLPIVVGWLRVGSQIQASSLRDALQHCNGIAHVATRDGPESADKSSARRAIMHGADAATDWFHHDELRAAPIFYYARVLLWSQSAEHVLALYWEASMKADDHVTVNGREWIKPENEHDPIHDDNRTGNAEQVMRYCQPPRPITPRDHQYYPPPSASLVPALGRRWSLGVVGRIAVAVAAALFLQWSTTGAAVAMTFLTPTVGLGCRSMVYLVYGTVATMSFFSFLISSLLAHACRPSSLDGDKTWKNQQAVRALSVVVRWAGKTLATLNAFMIVVGCTLQFAQVFINCYCTSSVIGVGKGRAYTLFLTRADLIALGTRDIWILGDVIAIAAAIVFGAFVFIAAPSR